jgi:acyl carrier protein
MIKPVSCGSREEVLQAFAKMTADRMDIPVASISEGKFLWDDLGFDSLDTIEVVMAVEEQFGIEVEVGDEDKLDTVGKVVDYIWEKLQRSR